MAQNDWQHQLTIDIDQEDCDQLVPDLPECLDTRLEDLLQLFEDAVDLKPCLESLKNVLDTAIRDVKDVLRREFKKRPYSPPPGNFKPTNQDTPGAGKETERKSLALTSDSETHLLL